MSYIISYDFVGFWCVDLLSFVLGTDSVKPFKNNNLVDFQLTF